jgi:hypothetical protein
MEYCKDKMEGDVVSQVEQLERPKVNKVAMNLAADMFIVRASEKRSFKPVQDLLAMSKIQSFIF